MATRGSLACALALAAASALGACGGDDGDGGNGGSNGSTCTAGTRVDLGDAGATPSCLRVAPGTVVTIANNRATAIEVRSAPHPTHGSCPELDATPAIAAGASIEVTMATVASCSFHDHATGMALGVIQVQSGSEPNPDPSPGPGY